MNGKQNIFVLHDIGNRMSCRQWRRRQHTQYWRVDVDASNYVYFFLFFSCLLALFHLLFCSNKFACDEGALCSDQKVSESETDGNIT